MHARNFRHCFALLTALAALGSVTFGFVPATQAQALTTLVSFTGTGAAGDTRGEYPYAAVTLDSHGNLFGTTVRGGAGSNGTGFNGGGTVWEIAAGTNTPTTLVSFTGANGVQPEAGVTIDSAGNLYGTTSEGGASNDGTVWEIPKGGSLTTLASFTAGANGYYPMAGVTLDSSGNLFGTTPSGGDANSDGTVWEIAHGTTTLTTLAIFTGGANGKNPYGGVTLDSQGNLYGTTEGGGSGSFGTVWEIAAGTNTIRTIASFSGGADGAYPYDSVTIDSSGNLYGTTNYDGGSASDGTVWEIAHGTHAITPLASFTGPNGANPFGGVTIDSAGNLFGTTKYGGSASDGVVWNIAHGTSTITALTSFTGPNGQTPVGGVTIDSIGNVYGTTEYGGSTYSSASSPGVGTVWEIAGAASVTPPPAHTHLLWDKTDGTASLWTVNPDGTYASAVYGPFSGWTARAVAAASDGTNWLLWTNTNGTAALWHVTALTATGYTATQYGPYAGYSAVSLSVDSGGNPHILWDKTDGTALLWTVNPTNGTFTYTSYGPFSGWIAKQVASGQTVTDLLWTNTNGTADGYRIAANGSLTQHTFGPYAGYAAKSLSVGPDDGAHLLWDKSDGTALLWNVDFSSGAFTYTSYGPFSGYAAKAIATGPDNVTHILWDATNGTASLWNVMGSGFTYHTYGPFTGWTAVGVSAGP